MRSKMFKLKRIVTFVLLAAFLATSLGSMLGFVCCDSGSLSETHIANHIDYHNDKATDGHVEGLVDFHAVIYIDGRAVSIDQHYRKTGDLCVDSSIEISSGIVDEIESVKILTDVDICSIPDELFNVKLVGLFVNNLTPKPLPRISQTILSHRTVVLLS